MKVVFVDDDQDLRDIVELALQMYGGFDVRPQRDVRQAIQCAIEWQPDLIVTDLNMPEMDGASLLAALKGDPRTLQIPVVFLTAGCSRATRESLLDAGAMAILEKPFDPRSLGSELARLVRDRPTTLAERMAAIRKRFRTRAAAEADALDRDWADDVDEATRLKRISDRAHALAGTAAMLELAGIAATARHLDRTIRQGSGMDLVQSALAELCNSLRATAIRQ